LGAETFEFPKYSTQIINLANQNAQGTRPAVVGQMSELIQEFTGKKIEEWEEWYIKRHPEAMKNATEKIVKMMDNLRDAMNMIDRQLIENWVKDLVVIKTFIGLEFQEAILKKASNLLKTSYRFSTPEEESRGIDGFVGDIAVSIKPETYKFKKGLSEKIDAKLIYYEKVKDGVVADLAEILPDL
jgi:hypothetical protein